MSRYVYTITARTEMRNTGLRIDRVVGVFDNDKDCENMLIKLRYRRQQLRTEKALKLLDMLLSYHTQQVTLNPTHFGELS